MEGKVGVDVGTCGTINTIFTMVLYDKKSLKFSLSAPSLNHVIRYQLLAIRFSLGHTPSPNND